MRKVIKIVMMSMILFFMSACGKGSNKDSLPTTNKETTNLDEKKSNQLRNISVKNTTQTIPKGLGGQVAVMGVYEDKRIKAVSQGVDFNSSDENIATVDDMGIISTHNEGNATIFARFGSFVTTTFISVTPAIITDISISKQKDENIPKGTSAKLTAMGIYSDGKTEDISDRVTWQSVSTDVATVSEKGVIEGKNQGTAKIQAQFNDIVSVGDISIAPAALVSISLMPPTGGELQKVGYISEGEKESLFVEGLFTDGSTDNIQATYSSNNETVASILPTGELVAKHIGDATITARVNGKDSSLAIRILASIKDIQNEPYYSYAWHLAYTPLLTGFVNKEANIHVEDAWRITRGAGVTVAVIDPTFFDIEHEEIKENIVDIYNADTFTTDVTTDYVTDENSHGSTVAGFIASAVNGKGLVGVAPEAKLVLIKQTYPSDSNTILAFEHAKEQGAKVICCSWGTNNVSQAVAQEFQKLKDEGITIIFASGNEGVNMDDRYINDESEAVGVIGIGATDEENTLASYSNYGSNIDLLAPGGDLSKSVGILGIDDMGYWGSYVQREVVDTNYAFTHGTSFAAPLVSGVVALMLSVNHNLTPYQIEDILIKSTDKIESNSANYINGYDKYRAYGKINATKAVNMSKNFTN